MICVVLAACGDDAPPTESGAELDAHGDAGDNTADDTQMDEDADERDADDPALGCDGTLPRPFDATGPFGTRRHDVAGNFTIRTVDGRDVTLSGIWSGCDSYLFVPDTLPESASSTRSVWEQGVVDLLAASPRNVHYFFISRRASGDAARTSTADMQARVDTALQGLDAADRAWWSGRLHVVADRAQDLDAWIGAALAQGVGEAGLAIDRAQRVRGIGSLADVGRYDAAAAARDEWPWSASLAYVANEARYYNFEALRQHRLDNDGARIVELWRGEVIEQFADMDVELPSAVDIAGYDTLEIDVSQHCPNPNAVEVGNCGAWDYLAHLWLFEGEERRIELGRHITTYHREGRWLIDITPALALLRDGGTRRFRWEWAPEWNVQPTATTLSLRFSNRGKGYRPTAVTPLFEGGAFNAAYNDARERVRVDVSASASRVELWAIITGHGAESSQCAEFCNHQHEFIVNDRSFYREHPDVGNQSACVDAVDQGAVPNQWGTWWFGRGGWCPGMNVQPFVVDVTSVVEPGATATFDYYGWLGGRTPPDAAGNVLVNAFLVTYEQSP